MFISRSVEVVLVRLPTVLISLALIVIPAGEEFACTPEAVWDGDGPVWCAEGLPYRLAGIAAHELDGSCSNGHPCPDTDPHAMPWPDCWVALGRGRHSHVLVEGPTMRCVSTGSVGRDRTGAWCVSPRSGDISCAMVRGGCASRWDRYWKEHRCR